jgi:polysaccharide pyruvyl transferase WcaK-like protein
MNNNDTAYILCKNPCYVPNDTLVKFIPYNALKAITGLLRADNVTVVGGTHFSNYGKMHRNFLITLRILAVAMLAKLFRKKVYFDSIGIVCGNWWLWMMLFLVTRFTDRVTVRDKVSKIILDTIGVKAALVEDLAVGLQKHMSSVSKNYDTLGVNVSPLNKIYFDYSQADDDILTDIARMIKQSVKYSKVKLIILREGDTVYTKKLELMVDKITEIAYYNENPVNALNEIAGCGHLLAMKYHACYFAKLAGVPFTNLSSHPKNERV